MLTAVEVRVWPAKPGPEGACGKSSRQPASRVGAQGMWAIVSAMVPSPAAATASASHGAARPYRFLQRRRPRIATAMKSTPATMSPERKSQLRGWPAAASSDR